MNKELEQALIALQSMSYPSISSILRKRGYEYEASIVEVLEKTTI